MLIILVYWCDELGNKANVKLFSTILLLLLLLFLDVLLWHSHWKCVIHGKNWLSTVKTTKKKIITPKKNKKKQQQSTKRWANDPFVHETIEISYCLENNNNKNHHNTFWYKKTNETAHEEKKTKCSEAWYSPFLWPLNLIKLTLNWYINFFLFRFISFLFHFDHLICVIYKFILLNIKIQLNY